MDDDAAPIAYDDEMGDRNERVLELAPRADHVKSRNRALLGFEENIKCPVAGFTAGAHYSVTRPR